MRVSTPCPRTIVPCLRKTCLQLFTSSVCSRVWFKNRHLHTGGRSDRPDGTRCMHMSDTMRDTLRPLKMCVEIGWFLVFTKDLKRLEKYKKFLFLWQRISSRWLIISLTYMVAVSSCCWDDCPLMYDVELSKTNMKFKSFPSPLLLPMT